MPLTIPQLTEKIRNNQFKADTDLFTAGINLPPGDIRDFINALADHWIPRKELVQAKELLDQKEELEDDPDFVGMIIYTNPAIVAESLADDEWMRPVIKKLTRLDRANIKNYITELENTPAKKKPKKK